MVNEPKTAPIKAHAKALNFYYGDFQALKNINFPIEENRITALIGPSGCGKSTFLRCFNRMHDLYPGHRYDGVINLLQARLVAHDNLLFNVGVTDCNAGMPRCFAFIYVEDSTGLITHDIRGNVFQSPDAGGTPPPWTNDPSVFPLMLPNCEDVGPTVNCLNSTSEMFPTINRFGMVRTFHPRLPRNRWDLALRGDADILTQGVGSETAGPHGIVGAPPLSYYADTAPADGIPDGWMARYPLLPLPFDPHGDFDGDGVDNQTEFDAGTSPTDPDTDGDGCNDGFSAMGEDTQPLDPTYPSGACN